MAVLAKAKTRQSHKHGPRSRLVRRLKSALIWVAVVGGVAGIIYALANTSSVPYTDRHITAVDFSSLNEDQKEEALVAANTDRCACGCGMTLAQCVVTDMTCPVRTTNLTRIRALVQKAMTSGGG